MIKLKPVVAALALSLVAGAAAAQSTTPTAPSSPTATPGIDKRLENQDKRIEQGKQTGALTPRESARLEKREAKIRSDVDAAKADGKVTKAERKQIHRELDHQSKAIARQKHDKQHDYNHDGKRDRRAPKQ